MILLDEQLMGRRLEIEIARWNRRPVCFLTDLHHRAVTKDDAIATLLRQHSLPTFVTINEESCGAACQLTTGTA